VVVISLDVDEKIKIDIKKRGFPYRGVFLRGYETIVNQNSHEHAIEELRKKLSRMSSLLDHYVVRCVNLEDEVKELTRYKNVMEEKARTDKKRRV